MYNIINNIYIQAFSRNYSIKIVYFTTLLLESIEVYSYILFENILSTEDIFLVFYKHLLLF